MQIEHAEVARKQSAPDNGPGIEASAEHLLAEYLREWGLRAPSVIAARCREWVRRAEGQRHRPLAGALIPQVASEATESSSPEGDLAHAALQEAMNDLNRWLDHLATFVSLDPTEATARRGLLAIAVQQLIVHHPEAFLQYEALPESLLRKLRDAARSVVPATTQRAQMQGPPLGELPPVLQPRRWRRVFRRLTTVILFIVGSRQR